MELLDVRALHSSFNFPVSGRLLYNGQPVGNKQIVIKVNGTAVAAVNTNSNGSYCLTLKLKAVDNKLTAYNIQAVFEGEDPHNASAYAYTPNSTRYAVCTTVQYGLKPATNMTTLTVDPHSTQVTHATKTPEQMQQEAERSGWLSMWHEFSWWYPWYRLHVKININPMIDIGFNPILPGGETADWNGLGFFSSVAEEILQELLLEAFGLVGMYLLARYASIPFFWVGLATEVSKTILQMALFLSQWNNAPKLLAAGLVSVAMCLFAVTSYYVKTSFFTKFVDALWSICGSAQGALRWMLVKLTEIAEFAKAIGRTWMDVVEAIVDASIAIVALCRYADLVG